MKNKVINVVKWAIISAGYFALGFGMMIAVASSSPM